jgi:hypothetical protein
MICRVGMPPQPAHSRPTTTAHRISIGDRLMVVLLVERAPRMRIERMVGAVRFAVKALAAPIEYERD